MWQQQMRRSWISSSWLSSFLAQAKEQGVELVGPDGLLNQLTRRVLETALEKEMASIWVRCRQGPHAGTADRDSTAALKLADGIGGRYRAFILAAAFTGLRWGGLLALRRMDIDLAAGTIRVHRSIAQMTAAGWWPGCRSRALASAQ